MSETKTFHTSLVVIADIHGNRWALEAVLQDIDRRGIQQIVNLGDHLTGPLDPAGTADLLIARGRYTEARERTRVRRGRSASAFFHVTAGVHVKALAQERNGFRSLSSHRGHALAMGSVKQTRGDA